MRLQGNLTRGWRVGAAFVTAMALSGCGGLPDLASVPASPHETLANLLSYGTPFTPQDVLDRAALKNGGLVCPRVEVRDGTESLRTYVGGQSNENVRYQFSMGEVARDCVHTGEDITIRVGIEGRVLIGPTGTPGTFTAPIRIAVLRRSDQKPETSKLYNIPVTIPASATEAPFRIVSEPIRVPYVDIDSNLDYIVEVGFDGGHSAVDAPVRRKKKR
jgi:hypothetical protein